jgi:hypothetical protein
VAQDAQWFERPLLDRSGRAGGRACMSPLFGLVANPRLEPWEPDAPALVAAIRLWAPQVAVAATAVGLSWVADGKALLGALAENESAFDRGDAPRFEPSYYYGSRKYEQSKELRDAIARQGALAACSWGPFQIMAMNALRLGYPLEEPLYGLWHVDVSLPYVVKLVQEILTKQKPPSPDDFADAYNSGNWRDSISTPVAQYRADFLRRFKDVVQRRGL